MTDINTEIETLAETVASREIIETAKIDMEENSAMVAEVIENKPYKAIKKQFDAECQKCHKHFKTKGVYEKHVGQQLCYGKHELSYCKTCNITLESHTGYIKHLMTAKHLGSIGVGKLEKLKEERPGVIHTADPYLSSNEAELLGTRNLGEKYTLVFENDNTQEVKLVRKPSSPPPPHQIQAFAQTKASTKDLIHPISIVEKAAPDRISQPTTRQLEIVQYLERQKNPIEANNGFIKVLTTKLELEDYYGLTTIIRENKNISLEVKQTILGLINKFVEGLTKKRVSGQTTYNNKDIAKVVVALSM
jgi:hypothetical protein